MKWSAFRKKHKGQGLTMTQLSQMYQQHRTERVMTGKSKTFSATKFDILHQSPVFEKMKRTAAGRRAKRIVSIMHDLPCVQDWPLQQRLLGIGTIGTVILGCKKNGTCAAIKINEMTSKEDIDMWNLENENQRAAATFAPKIYSTCLLERNGKMYGGIAMELLGEELDTYLSKKRTKAELEHVGRSLTRILRFLVRKKMTHGDMALFNFAFRQGTDDLVMLDFDRASTRVFSPAVDVLRLRDDFWNPSGTEGTKPILKSNLPVLRRFSREWHNVADVSSVPWNEVEQAWFEAYEKYCLEAGVKCLE
jgi:hypothetical protein